MQVQIRRVYDPPQPDDGRRVLVDRLWPRGLSKERARLDDWCREIAPSTELRKWYDHDPDRYVEFARRYRAELDDPEPSRISRSRTTHSADRHEEKRHQRGSRPGRPARRG